MRPLLAAALVLAVPAMAIAQPAPAPAVPATSTAAPPSAEAQRYALERTDNGAFVRLDRRTGAMSYCQVTGSDLDCRASADERAALQAEIDRLAGQVDALKGGSSAGAGQHRQAETSADQELGRMRGLFEDLVRRLIAIVRGIEPRTGNDGA